MLNPLEQMDATAMTLYGLSTEWQLNLTVSATFASYKHYYILINSPRLQSACTKNILPSVPMLILIFFKIAW